LSILPLRCPNCGSATSDTQKTGEYSCDHCGIRFQITRPQDKTDLTDRRAHNCPICGKPVSIDASYKCTECGRVYLCDACVAKVPGLGFQKNVCRDCMISKGWACLHCGEFSKYVCVNCLRMTCEKHQLSLFVSEDTKSIVGRYCEKCGGFVCKYCAKQKSGFLSTKHTCPRCGLKLLDIDANVSKKYASMRGCKYCGRVIGEVHSCPVCGKSQR
jgi:DNA-directed RNA polymerase subunit RPC12/RpoP